MLSSPTLSHSLPHPSFYIHRMRWPAIFDCMVGPLSPHLYGVRLLWGLRIVWIGHEPIQWMGFVLLTVHNSHLQGKSPFFSLCYTIPTIFTFLLYMISYFLNIGYPNPIQTNLKQKILFILATYNFQTTLLNMWGQL